MQLAHDQGVTSLLRLHRVLLCLVVVECKNAILLLALLWLVHRGRLLLVHMVNNCFLCISLKVKA